MSNHDEVQFFSVIYWHSVGKTCRRRRRRGLVICELRTGNMRTTDANLGYNANQKVRTFYAIKRGPYTCFGIINAIQK